MPLPSVSHEAKRLLTWALSRRAAQPLNKALFLVALRGLGLNAAYGDGISYPEQRFLKKLRGVVGDRPLVLDVGANVGQFASAVRRIFPAPTVHSFEPNPVAAEKLRAQLPTSSPSRCHNFALGEETGSFELHDIAVDGGSTFASLSKEVIDHAAKATARPAAAPRIVPVRRLDDWLREAGLSDTQLDLLKVDTEGHELSVLKGATELLAAGRACTLMLEFNYCNAFTRVFLRDIRQAAPAYTFYRLLYSGELMPIDEDPKFSELFAYQVLIGIRSDWVTGLRALV